jgi:hypothetical protein
MICTVSKQEAIHSDEPEQYSANELVNMLIANECTWINNELYDLAMITDKIDAEKLKEFTGSCLFGESPPIKKLYIDTVAEIMKAGQYEADANLDNLTGDQFNGGL